MNLKQCLVYSVSIIVLSHFLQTASAEERGTFKAITIMTYDYTTIERSGYAYIGGPAQGGHVVVESSGGPFAVDAMENIRCFVFAKGQKKDLEIEAPCEITDMSGDKLHIIAGRTSAEIPEGTAGEGSWQVMDGTGEYEATAEGIWHIVDGTGKYEKIRGKCTYTTQYLKDGVVGIPSNCEWMKKEH